MMAFVELEDLYGIIELIVFPKIYDNCSQLLKADNIVLVEGRVTQREDEDAKIICDRITIMDKRQNIKLYIKVDTSKQPNIFKEIKKILLNYKGSQPLYIIDDSMRKNGKPCVKVPDKDYWININDNLINELKSVLGEQCVAMKN
jgi:DNA polymerase-3 subunit alpha